MIITNKKMDYLTIKEFAEEVGISPQAVYKQLNKRLLPYVKTENGKKYISRGALGLYSTGSTTNSTRFNNQLNEESAGNIKGLEAEQQPVGNQFNNRSTEVKQPVEPDKDLLLSMLETLQKELDRKEEALQAERKRNDDLNSQLAEAFQKIARMGSEAQFLTSQTVGLLGSRSAPDDMTSTAPEIIIDADAPDVVQEKKKKKKKEKKKKKKKDKKAKIK